MFSQRGLKKIFYHVLGGLAPYKIVLQVKSIFKDAEGARLDLHPHGRKY